MDKSVTSPSTSDSHNETDAADVNQQQPSTTGVSSFTKIQQNIPAVAGEKINVVETLAETVVPAAGEALQSAQETIRSLAGKAVEKSESIVDEETASPHPDHKIIDEMHDERICDFLRDKHRSTAPPPKTKD